MVWQKSKYFLGKLKNYRTLLKNYLCLLKFYRTSLKIYRLTILKSILITILNLKGFLQDFLKMSCSVDKNFYKNIKTRNFENIWFKNRNLNWSFNGKIGGGNDGCGESCGDVGVGCSTFEHISNSKISFVQPCIVGEIIIN